MSEHALNHRFRRVRAQVLIIQEGRKSGRDMKDLDVGEHLPTTKDAVETNSTHIFTMFSIRSRSQHP